MNQNGDEPAGLRVHVIASDERETALQSAGIEDTAFRHADRHTVTRFEARADHDYIAVFVPSFIYEGEHASLLEIFIKTDVLLVIADPALLAHADTLLQIPGGENESPAHRLSLLFGFLLPPELRVLQAIEDKIERLEERATGRKPEDHSLEIIALRKQLMVYKRYFESLQTVLEELAENQNELFSKHQLQMLHVHENRAGRYLGNVLNLRDYLTQVREAYQNQLDISLNETMRFFTVITSIFLPLTLIVGWYGMNLRMPELEFAVTYPIVIAVSLAFIVFSLVYSKRKGWF